MPVWARQERLKAAERPEIWVVLDEAVLRRPVGGPAVMRGQMRRLLAAAARPEVAVQVLPFNQGEHEAMGGSLTVLALPYGAEVAYLEGAENGQLIEEPGQVKRYSAVYIRLRAMALPPKMSLDMIRGVMEGDHCGTSVPSRSERRRLAQEQLQQSGGRQLRGGRGRSAGRRARA